MGALLPSRRCVAMPGRGFDCCNWAGGLLVSRLLRQGCWETSSNAEDPWCVLHMRNPKVKWNSSLAPLLAHSKGKMDVYLVWCHWVGLTNNLEILAVSKYLFKNRYHFCDFPMIFAPLKIHNEREIIAPSDGLAVTFCKSHCGFIGS